MGIVLEGGVEAVAEVRPAPRPSVRVVSESEGALPISLDVARRLWSGRQGHLVVHLRHELPIAHGFGMSAAGATATALAVATLARTSVDDAVEVAHLADLFGGGGLGGVASILGGGMENRTAAGIPPFGRVRHRSFPYPTFLILAGRPLPSPGLLASSAFLDRVASVGLDRIAGLGPRPEPLAFLQAAEEFTDELGLAPPKLSRFIHRLRGREVRVAQAMLGRSAFAVPLSVAGRRSLVLELLRSGATAVEFHAERQGARALPSRSPGKRY
ncbi:MAG: hypothetical protein L3J93_00340 [Thermoplasmata archaeon]|nr:hypothetical protein [Thermoplasmata archaeon]